MSSLFLGIAILVALLTTVGLYRVAIGRTIFDRVLAAGLVGTNGFILLVVIGFIYNRIDMFVDIAITYALLNFIMAVVMGKYLERKEEKPR